MNPHTRPRKILETNRMWGRIFNSHQPPLRDHAHLRGGHTMLPVRVVKVHFLGQHSVLGVRQTAQVHNLWRVFAFEKVVLDRLYEWRRSVVSPWSTQKDYSASHVMQPWFCTIHIPLNLLDHYTLASWPVGPEGSMLHSQELFNNPYPKLIKEFVQHLY